MPSAKEQNFAAEKVELIAVEVKENDWISSLRFSCPKRRTGDDRFWRSDSELAVEWYISLGDIKDTGSKERNVVLLYYETSDFSAVKEMQDVVNWEVIRIIDIDESDTVEHKDPPTTSSFMIIRKHGQHDFQDSYWTSDWKIWFGSLLILAKKISFDLSSAEFWCNNNSEIKTYN